jgi:archaellum component FlaC
MNCLYGKLNSETIKKEYKTSDTIEVLEDKLNVIKTPETLTIIKNSATGDSETFLFDGQNPVTIDLHEVDAYAGRENYTAKTIVDIENNTIEVEVQRTPGTLYLMKGEEVVGTFDGNINTYITLPETDLSGIESSLQDLNGRIEETQSSVGTLQQELVSTKTDVKNIETRIDGLSNSINTTNSTIQGLSGYVEEIKETSNIIQEGLTSVESTLTTVEEDVSILETNGDGTKYLADDGQYKEVVSGVNGIEQLVGTAETPVNLYNLKSGQLYAVQNFVGSTSDYYTITSGTLLVYKQSSNICIFEHCRLVSSSRIINITNSTLSQSYLVTVKSSGQLTIEVASTGVNRLNGSTDYLGPVSFFAPINGGANGQILQANGYSTAPTWVTPDYASQSYVDEQIANLGQTAESNNLKLPEVAPGVQQIVSINSDGIQQNLTLGEGVSIEDGMLKASGGKLYNHQISLNPLKKGSVTIVNTSPEVFTKVTLPMWLYEKGYKGLGTVVLLTKQCLYPVISEITLNDNILSIPAGIYSKDGTQIGLYSYDINMPAGTIENVYKDDWHPIEYNVFDTVSEL